MKNSHPSRERLREDPAASSGPSTQLVSKAPQLHPDRPKGDPSHEEIADRAYKLWAEGDRAHGHDQQHWFAAERELRGLST